MAFLATWASISRGDLEGIVPPALSEASQFFPPKPSSPQDHLSLTESLWFAEGNYITKRFVFDAKAIALLKEKAGNGNPEAKISRIVTLSCFIWKCCMSATKALPSAHPKPSILVEAVNLRLRTKPPMSDGSIGNNFWWTGAIAQPMDEKSTELYKLVDSLNEAIAVHDNDTTSESNSKNHPTFQEIFRNLNWTYEWLVSSLDAHQLSTLKFPKPFSRH
ncbi:hypothetical protein Tsubulata_023384 [Turnera subulata]|uniref:Uncharacterized protein n=1 Tax=Turnera subulata TaxID=218843 RepID=A0A9Q0J3G4_9ROSI|nr:hypothetical protein Tsubulata_023384 [Turnera subulata]